MSTSFINCQHEFKVGQQQISQLRAFQDDSKTTTKRLLNTRICVYVEYSILNVAFVYVEPKAAASQNAIKNDEKATSTIAMHIQQAIDKDPTPQCPLIFVCWDFNTAKCAHFVRMLGVKLLATARDQRLLDRVCTNASPCYNTKTIPALSIDTNHDIVIATPINQLYKATRGTNKTITARSGKISDTIEEIGNIDWQLLTRTTASSQARFGNLYDTIKDIQDTCQALKTAKLKNDEAWMTPRIKEEIAKR
jgi:hypothetical protein